MEQRPDAKWFLAGLLAVLGIFSLYLALNRMYQVDEAQNVFMARIIGTRQTGSYLANPEIWLVGPLAWLASSAKDSALLFEWNRLIFLGVFWINLLLLTLCTGVRLRSNKGLFVLLMAATLAPLWDYGFEIRHDNLLLTGLLLMWWVGRTRPRGVASYASLGLVAVLLQFTVFKAFAYVLPLSMGFLLFPPPAHGQTRLRLSLAWVAGALVAFLVCRLAYGASGLWSVFAPGLGRGIEMSSAATRFSPWISLNRPLTQTPLLLAVVAAALASYGRSLYRKDWSGLDWAGTLPECLLFLGTLGVLFINPTPFPYNLVNLIPFAFLLAFRFLDPFLQDVQERSVLPLLAGGVLLFTHLVPFATATWRHLEWKNDRQELLMQTAENLTDPDKDPVYDGIGMVPTRPSIHARWFLHSLNIHSFLDGKESSIAKMLEAHPAAVFIPSYRTEWLSKVDWTFIQSHYVPLADDFWVLGQVLPSGGGPFKLSHPGRYQLLGKQNGQVMPLTASGTLDGHPLERGGIAELSAGSHELICLPQIQPACFWVGPKADRLPELPPRDHLRLFVNWY